MMSQQPEAPPPLVALEGVTKRFPGVVANDRISLSIRAGEVQALLGENGAGKSTLISLLAGMQQPDEGRILVEGRPVRLGSPREALRLGIGTVYQHSTLVPSLTVLENLILGAPWWRRLDRAGTRARLAEITAKLGVSLPENAVLGRLSLGEQQLVEIVKALWLGERLLILDEATSMLTPKGVEDLRAVVGRLREAGIAVLFITHKLSEALAFGDSISVLKAGRLVGGLSVAELRALGEQEALDCIVDMMFGTRGEQPAAEAARRLGEAGPTILEVEGLSVAAGPMEPQVREVGFQLHAGEILGIAGVDGNGQKQLAEALAGQRAATAGTIRLEGRPIQAAGVPARQRAGLRYVTDDRLGEGTIGAFPVSLNLLLKRIGTPPFWRGGVEQPEEIDRHARALIERHDVRTPGPATPIGRLSGGNIQKALLGRELDDRPKVVVYNKPTYGLDLSNIRLARAAIREQAAQGVATVLISTDLDEILELSDRIGVMLRGRLVGVVANDAEARRRIGELMIGSGAQA